MSDKQLPMLQSEWITLQNQFDSYEKCSLAIKLFSILLCCMLVFALDAGAWPLLVAAILWLQDGIWKTFQNRIGKRLEVVEQAIQDNPHHLPEHLLQMGMQFNLAWTQSRPRAIGLVREYIQQSLKPTVAYPHVVLVFLVIGELYVN
ncbi:hypothetical protein [Paraglaciecola sp. MB-3u-78]|jgi:hypothetical protein|uniref:hypothetical protein n=1 Tax=Paraglaciecola sp. MB-3u-78 TaxID=2058332 RepID=UPI000C33622C|nr:hypothetical protein [Paraglaciecola sp. MB-3u-78]PKG98268.1 hypothetical protein CXF95_18030 [Paraglaciecola sp. MB-3u-78]